MPILAALGPAIAGIGSFLGPVGIATLGSSVVGAGASLLGSKMQADASKNALGQAQGLVGPFAQAGQSALPTLLKLLGIGPGGSDPNMIQNILASSPGYQFAHDLGMKGVNQDLAAKGLLNSGAAVRDTAAFNQGLANQTFDSYFNKLFGTAQMGQQAATGLADTSANLLQQRATAQAGGLTGVANQVGQIPANLLLSQALQNRSQGNNSGYNVGTYPSGQAASNGLLGL